MQMFYSPLQMKAMACRWKDGQGTVSRMTAYSMNPEQDD